MKKYNRDKKFSVILLVSSVLWFLVSMISLIESGPSISIATTIVCIIGYFLVKRPYILISSDYMEVYHNTIVSKKYEIKKLKIVNQSEKVISFEYQNGQVIRKFKIHLNRLGSQDAVNFKGDIYRVLPR